MSVDFELRGAVALITMNRPERLNAMDAAAYEALSAAWQRVRDDPAVRVAVITGAGERSFSTGADIKSFLGTVPDLGDFWLTQKGQLLNRGLELWKPVIAAVNGYCIGGGMTLLLATDIRVAAEHATFGLSEVKRGVMPANGGTQRLLSQVPHAIGMEMLLTGRAIDAQTAERWGIVNKVVPMAELMDAALAYAEEIAANAPLAVQATKELALRAREMDLNTGLRLEQAINRVLQSSEDAQEGIAAFGAKRPPEFTGR
jgi:enoyl-CoA hydratase/carnithine racemase